MKPAPLFSRLTYLQALIFGALTLATAQGQAPPVHEYPNLEEQPFDSSFVPDSLVVDGAGNDHMLFQQRNQTLQGYRRNNEPSLLITGSESWTVPRFFLEEDGQFRVFYTEPGPDARNRRLLTVLYRPSEPLPAPTLLLEAHFTFEVTQATNGSYLFVSNRNVFSGGITVGRFSPTDGLDTEPIRPGALAEATTRATKFGITASDDGVLHVLTEVGKRGSTSADNTFRMQYFTYDFDSAQPPFAEIITLPTPAESSGIVRNLTLGLDSAGQPFAIYQNFVENVLTLANRTLQGWNFDNQELGDESLASLADGAAYLNDRGRPTVLMPLLEDKCFRAELNGETWAELPRLDVGIGNTRIKIGPTRTPHFFSDVQVGNDRNLRRARYLDATDLDGDGLLHLLEVAFDSDPNDATERKSPRYILFNRTRPSILTDSLDNPLLVGPGTYQFVDQNIEIRAEVSSDLINWGPQDNIESVPRFTVGQQTLQFIQRDSVTTGEAEQFMRLKVFRGF